MYQTILRAVIVAFLTCLLTPGFAFYPDPKAPKTTGTSKVPAATTAPGATKTPAAIKAPGKSDAKTPEATSDAVPATAAKAPAKVSETDPVASVVAAEEAFSASLLSAQTASPKSEPMKAEVPRDLVVSPYGVYETLAMLRTATGGKTRQALDQVLGGPADDGQLAKVLGTLRTVGDPYVLQLGPMVADNDNYGVKVIANPEKSTGAAAAGLGEGDLIFSVDDLPVRTASELVKECAASLGKVNLSGYDYRKGEVFTEKSVTLTRVRQLASPPDRQLLNVSNAFLIDSKLKVQEKFTKQLETLYRAPTFTGDFAKPADLESQARAHFTEATAGRNSQFQLPKDLTPDTRFVLANVLAMEAQWKRKFPPATGGTFHAPEKDVPAQMMRQTAQYRLAELETFRVLELPYRDSSLVMWILLPSTADGWKKLDLSQVLASQSLSQIRSAMKMGRVDAMLPKFRIEHDESLKSVLAQLGLGELFTTKADFTLMTPDNDLMLSDVRQQVFIEVNEQGTRAGAVTQAIGVVKSIDAEPKHFHADHPFLFVIRDDLGGIYFAGRVLNPVAPPAKATTAKPDPARAAN